MPEYDVPIVPREWLALWHKCHPLDGPPSAAALAADQDGSLSQTICVKANNAREAAAKAERERPGCVAIFDAILKLGR